MDELELINKLLKIILAGLAIETGIKIKSKRNKLGTSRIGKDLGRFGGNDGIRLSKNYQLSEKASQEHIFLVGPSGEFKTTGLLIPNLLSPDLKGSIIVSDPKGELHRLTHKFQKQYRKVLVYKPLEKGLGYNPLANCRNDREVKELAQTLLINGALSMEISTGKQAQGVEWLQMSESLLTAALLYSKQQNGSIQTALKIILYATPQMLDDIFYETNDNIRNHYLIFKSCMESPKTASSIKVTLGSNLSLFTDDRLNIINNDFDVESFRKEPTILYITYPENKSTYLAPLMSCMYSQIINRLIDIYTDDSLPIYFLGEEFAHLGSLDNFVSNIATARSRKISFFLCLQSITQLEQIYGKKNTLSILNNCKSKIIMPSLTDPVTLDYFSKICGEQEIIVQQQERNIKAKKSLFTSDELRRIYDDELLLVIGNKYPILDKKNFYFKSDIYNRRINGKVN